MERKWTIKVIFTLLLTVFAATALVPTFAEKNAAGDGSDSIMTALRDLFPGINLGLDLQGGLRLKYEVEVAAAIEDKRDQIGKAIVDELAEKVEISGVKLVRSKTSDSKFSLVFPSEEDLASHDAKEILKNYRRHANVEKEEGSALYMSLVDELVEDTEDGAVKQAIETIGNRIDELGLVNTTVARSGVDIVVEIPGVDEKQIERIKRIISTTARLEFKIVDEEGSKKFFVDQVKPKIPKDGDIKLRSFSTKRGVPEYFLQAKNEPGKEGRSGRQILKAFLKDFEVPEGRQVAYKEEQALDDAGRPTADIAWRTFFVERTAGMTGEYVDNAGVQTDQQGKPYVSLSFDQIGGQMFGELTGKNVERRMAIILDDKVNSAPVINEKIGGGRAQITLGGMKSFSQVMTEAQEMVLVLRAGALPAPVKPVTEASIGPQLGHDSIAMGKLAFIVAGAIVLLFMLFYYRGGGVAADLALICNFLFLGGILSGANATLTLPGIAGIILTGGMAVDANVIIYERIREELRGGKSPRAAVDAGYSQAFWTIFDAQITTFIAGVVMLQYGTGAVKGFAVTLLIGIITSMFSAIFISRIIFDYMTRRRTDHLSI